MKSIMQHVLLSVCMDSKLVGAYPRIVIATQMPKILHNLLVLPPALIEYSYAKQRPNGRSSSEKQTEDVKRDHWEK